MLKKTGYISFISLLFTAFTIVCNAQSANDFKSVVPYTGLYGYGNNMGYYGGHLSDQNVALLAYNSGARTIRPSLPDRLITGYGLSTRITAFQYYHQIGLRDLTAFVGEPNMPLEYRTKGPDNRDTITFPGCSERAKTFKGLYEPIWLDDTKTEINPENTYAAYLYKTVRAYGQFVKFWEIVNEPDFTYGSSGWQAENVGWGWWKTNPTPDELENLKAPIFYYIRTLRISWEVIKKLYPDSYVCTGGIGYPSFLDCILRNTDNPENGKISADYPLKGGAYFDVLSFHDYPMYHLNYWDNDNGGSVKFRRNSDAMVDVHLKYKDDYANLLKKYGYNDLTYPAKKFITTETDVARDRVGVDWGSVDAANNYIIKCHVLSQKDGITQVYKYGLGESSNFPNTIFNKMGVYGNLSIPGTKVANAIKNPQFKATVTLTEVLYGKRYDAKKTTELHLPATIRGAAFKDSTGSYTYVLWAKTGTDLTEKASAKYTFPFAFTGFRKEWDFSETHTALPAGKTVQLGGNPSFFTPEEK